ncbi:Inner membrane transport protein YhaO [Proteus mirabilis]|uniref:Inner membrane transport protein YhaO n=1 Tax=Proteus mirabilis TaxID=584 RepID=A0A2X2BI63_PROMI|nr:Inner membrane transport protein YhaO [Proteus mirabilis]
MTAFFGVYLGFREATQGIVMNILQRMMPVEKINEKWVQNGIMIFCCAVSLGRHYSQCTSTELYLNL